MSGATFTFRNGKSVELRKLNQTVLQSILYDIASAVEGVGGDAQKPEAPPERLAAADAIGMRLFKYCAGWGIADLPDEDDLGVLKAMSYDGVGEHLLRLAWVQFCLLSNGDVLDEASDLIHAVMTHTYVGLPVRQAEEADADI